MYASPLARSVLVAGHSQNEIRLLRHLFRRLGVRDVRTARDGSEAVAAMACSSPDLLILDWNIQATPADMVVKAAKEKQEAGPKILLTMASPTRSAVAAASDLEIDSIVARPFSPSAFMDRLPGRFARKSAKPDVKVADVS